MKSRMVLLFIAAFVSISAIAASNLDVGIPKTVGLQKIDHEGFSLGYQPKWKIASWVQYRLTESKLRNSVASRTEDFREDPYVKDGASTLEDYRRSGYDRGHLAPAADMKWSAKTMSESFYLSNMTPQLHAFNAEIWERLEAACRTIAHKEKSIVIVTGPVMDRYGGKTIGAGRVAVPPAFYKVIYDETPPQKMIGFIVPHENSRNSIAAFACSVDEVEKRTGLDFFNKVPNSDKLEASFDINDWTLPGKEYNLPGMPKRK